MKLPKIFNLAASFILLLQSLVNCQSINENSNSSVPIPTNSNWKLVWHDEFDGKVINPKNWAYDVGGGGWGNNELEVYTDRRDNARVENGFLVIEARKEDKGNGHITYTSARLKTEGLQTFQYGRIEARLKVPPGAGLWPAFWMLGANISEVDWPQSGEIDIMEYTGKRPDTISGTLHGPGYSGPLSIGKRIQQSYQIADDFHLYAVEWDKNEINWFYEGVKYFTVQRTDVGRHKWVFDQPFFILLNLAVGGTSGGHVSKDTVFPAQYQVDYVRVFQKEE